MGKKLDYRTKYLRTILQSKKNSLLEIFQRNFGRWCFKYKAWAAEVTGLSQTATDEKYQSFIETSSYGRLRQHFPSDMSGFQVGKSK